MIARHLRTLEDAGVVRGRREGRHRFYEIRRRLHHHARADFGEVRAAATVCCPAAADVVQAVPPQAKTGACDATPQTPTSLITSATTTAPLGDRAREDVRGYAEELAVHSTFWILVAMWRDGTDYRSNKGAQAIHS